MEPIEVLAYSVDEEGKTIGLGTSYGFVVYGFEKKDPYVRFKKILGHGIGLISVYKSSNIVAYVGGGKNPYSKLNDVEVWDDRTSSIVFKKKFESDICGISLKKNFFIVALKNVMYVYRLSTGFCTTILTSPNLDGVFAYYEKTELLLTLSEESGCINMYCLKSGSPEIETIQTNIKCFKYPISNISIDPSGKFAVVFCIKTQYFHFIDLQTKQIYYKISNQGTTIKKQPFILLSPAILVAVTDGCATFYDILKNKKNKFYIMKLDKAAPPAIAFLTTWQQGGPKLHIIDKNGKINICEVLVNPDLEVSTTNILTKALL
ncbi:hypothetical protein ENUP19_0346G0024 [Entamoeba nuttalli]|uniref:WD domain, G-beta repeat-containing protein n=2 Tax=Entamoeba nuttalli TaxID=412467 RepID=K2H438_ENTNP|nr:hypothetical protein ENU1_205600 [Entamoeba nuttalli P19]EKE37199.1 hypothetical protein ENU1_205600 [Entamoeba nuttalli P19]|eukprot:XP_008860462.1 hypothetical protein ENU1_205600 [Entamoeba nuttalli P19]